MKRYTADFETSTWVKNETWVWAWGVCDIEDITNITIGNNIETFIEFVKKLDNPTIYMHNLKFDGEFLIHYLLSNGYKHTEKNNKEDKTFSTLISNMGLFYSLEIYFKKTKNISKVTFIDSLKLINLPIEAIPKAFGIEENKLSLDYNKVREKDHKLTEDEIAYLKNDIIIPAKALSYLFNMGLTKMTAGSNALYDFKKMITYKKFKNMFRPISYLIDADIRQAYRGGFTYCNPLYKNKSVGRGNSLDINSMYPAIMKNKMLPFGEPFFFEGEYQEDKVYPLYIQRLTCTFKLKEGKIPTIQIKGSRFVENEYLTSSGDLPVSLTLTNIDLKLFLDNYEVSELTYNCGWKFKAIRGLFTEYIDKWIAVKNEGTRTKNKGLRQVAKILLNSIYGKYGTALKVQSKIPYLEDEVVKYKLGEEEKVDGVYLPMAVFITSYGREQIIRTSQKITDYSLMKYNKDLYYYSDTDSIKCGVSILELKQIVDIDDVELGYWKHEDEHNGWSFNRAKFIRQKTYLTEIWNEKDENYEIKITCAGMPQRCYNQVTWDNFKEGLKVDGKLLFKHVKGGVLLVDTEYTLKEDKKLIKAIQKF